VADDFAPWKRAASALVRAHSIVADAGFYAPETWDFHTGRVAALLLETAEALGLPMTLNRFPQETKMAEKPEEKKPDVACSYEIKVTFTRDLGDDLPLLKSQREDTPNLN